MGMYISIVCFAPLNGHIDCDSGPVNTGLELKIQLYVPSHVILAACYKEIYSYY